MTEWQERQFEPAAGCPIPQMTFGEIARFLQHGYEAPIQKSIAAHVENCASCQAAIVRFDALRETGRHLIGMKISEREEIVPRNSPHLDEATLAAFVDNGLAGTERQRAAKHLAECHACYSNLAALEKELHSPVAETSASAAFKTPVEILEQIKEKVYTPVEQIKSPLKNLTENLADWGGKLWDLRWPAPALGFAMGILFMLLITAQQEKPANFFVMMPLIKSTSSEEEHVLSGLLPDSLNRPEHQSAELQLEIPYRSESEIHFQWPAVPGCIQYRVRFYDAADTLLFKEMKTVQNQLSISMTRFTPGARYSILVIGIYQEGSVGPVTKMRFRLPVR